MKALVKILPLVMQGILLLAMHPHGLGIPPPPAMPRSGSGNRPGSEDIMQRPPPDDIGPGPGSGGMMRPPDGMGPGPGGMMGLPNGMKPPKPGLDGCGKDGKDGKDGKGTDMPPPQNAFNPWAGIMGGFPPQMGGFSGGFPGGFPGGFQGMPPPQGGIPPQMMMMLPYLKQMMEASGWGDKMGWGNAGEGGWDWNDMWPQEDDDNDEKNDDYWSWDGWGVGQGGFPMPFPGGFPIMGGGYPGMGGGFPGGFGGGFGPGMGGGFPGGFGGGFGPGMGGGFPGGFGGGFGPGMGGGFGGGLGLEDMLERGGRRLGRRDNWDRRDDDRMAGEIRWFKMMMIKKALQKMLFKAAYMGAMFSKVKLPPPPLGMSFPGMPPPGMPIGGMPTPGMPFPGMPFPGWPFPPPPKPDRPDPRPKPPMLPQICKVSVGNQTISRSCKYPGKVCAMIMQPKCREFEISVCLPPKCAGLPPIEMKMCILRKKKELMMAGNYKNVDEMIEALEEKMPPEKPDIEIDPFKKCLSEEDFFFMVNGDE